ncbi:hypothetical protein [Singulisphaera sp. PoT]|uniref:hypothetical protein n=1 Tax=Singulisphaera sp. PoT TaxID=3411797 RepID=UPI003BF56794
MSRAIPWGTLMRQSHRCLVAITISALITLGLGRAFGDDVDPKEAFRREYLEAAKVLEAHYHDISVEVHTHTRKRSDAGVEETNSRQFLSRSGRNACVISSTMGERNLPAPARKKLGPDMSSLVIGAGSPERITFYNSEHATSLLRTPPSRLFSIISSNAVITGTKSRVDRSLALSIDCGTLAAGGISIATLLSDKGSFLIENIVRETGPDGTGRLRVTLWHPRNPTTEFPEKNSRFLRQATFVFNPGEHWVLDRYEMRWGYPRFPLTLFEAGTVEYEGSVGGFPTPKRIHVRSFSVTDEVYGASKSEAALAALASRSRGGYEETQEFHNLTLGSSPDWEFTTGAFGVMRGSPPGKPSKAAGIPPWLLPGTGLTFLLGLIFKCYESRHHRVYTFQKIS